MHLITRLFLAGTLLAGVPAAAQEEVDATDWRQAAEQDIEAAYIVFQENHPGWYDPTNPGFRATLAKARDAGFARAAKADGPRGYDMALGAFNEVLSDGHASLYPLSNGTVDTNSLSWPGFVAAWRGSNAVVHSVGDGFSLPVGSVLSGCDDRPIREVFRERGLTIGLRPAEEGRWWFRVPSLMLSGADDTHRPHTCTFVRPDGVTVAQQLSWTPIPADFDQRRNAASDGDRKPIGLTEPSEGIFWIALPDFAPDEEGQAAYETLFADLAAQRETLKSTRAVVLDLRYNNGGSSQWSNKVARALWGAAAVDRRTYDYFSGTNVWYRASPENTAYGDEIVKYVAKDAELVEYFSVVRDGMKAALAKGEPYYVTSDTPEEVAKALAKSPLTDFSTPVYVITPGRCASACLDAVDVFTRFSNVTLIGAPTSADTTYMEIRRHDLPSGHGRMNVPIKFYHGRPRESGQVYQPRIRIDSLDWSSATFLEAIEKDLGKGG